MNEFPPKRPSSPDLDLDNLLHRFLADVERDRAEGNTLAQVRREIFDIKLESGDSRRLIEEVRQEQKLQRLRSDRHGADIRMLKAHVFDASDDGPDTGVNQVEDLKRLLKEKQAEVHAIEKEKRTDEKERRDSIWWKRQKIQWAVGAAGAGATFVIGGLGTLIWYLVTHVSHTPGPGGGAHP